MGSLYDNFIELMSSFEKNEVEYVLIGGLAINLHGFNRNTQDIDLFVNSTEENINKLKKSLFQVFEDDDIDEISIEELNKFPVIRYGSSSGIQIDLIVKLGEVFCYSDLSIDIKEIDGIKIRYANLKTLYKLKEKTYREIDQLDLKFIKSKLDKNGNKKI